MTEKENVRLSSRLRKRKVWCSAIVYFYGHFILVRNTGTMEEVYYIAIGALCQKCNPVLV
jgi:hypothetical protein